ncbi:MAG: PHP domain-containing protein [Clostridia bacterium]|nr:PHP domain-containing protein [Clostridia bacterium]
MNPYYYDLHVHSCLSPCADDDMTPNNIVGMAALKGLTLLALTDHNSCKNCPAFFDACRSQGIVPVAGMELTTAEDIHLLCLFEHLEEAMAFDREVTKHLMSVKNRPEIFGNQWILDNQDDIIGKEERLLISATDLWMEDALELAKKFGAHVHPAHIDRESNGIVAILGSIPAEYEFTHFEFNCASNFSSYHERFPYLETTNVLICSDAHHLWDINEAEHYLMLEDEPYSSSLVRKKLFELLTRRK